ncbi:MAG: DUF3616 domain-containing protein [Vicinamibacteraceae bacterium]
MMTKPILLIAAATTIGAAAVALPGLDLVPDSPPAAEFVELTGACDASAGLLLDGRHLVVADDEDKETITLRVYDLEKTEAKLEGIDATPFLDAKGEEVDLEGLTVFGSRYVAIGSHSRNKEKVEAPTRHRILAFTLAPKAPPNQQIATSHLYSGLLIDAQKALKALPATSPLSGFLLDNGSAPKDGGLSIEAVSDTATGGELLIGLRSPLSPKGKAIVLRLTNAGAVLDSHADPVFAEPILLDLPAKDGHAQGLRDLVRDGTGGYLLIAGDVAEGGSFRLWKWSGPGTGSNATPVADIKMPAEKTSAEALVLTPDKKAGWILFDEGERDVAGKACKKAANKAFHASRIPASAF